MKTLKLAQLPLIIIISILLFFNKKNRAKIEDGIYTGTFKVLYPTGTHIGKTTLELRNSNYTCDGNSNRIPAGGSGTYEIEADSITFHDENIWTADFDWNLILKGTYNYSFNGKNLKIYIKKNNGGNYEYDLVKK